MARSARDPKMGKLLETRQYRPAPTSTRSPHTARKSWSQPLTKRYSAMRWRLRDTDGTPGEVLLVGGANTTYTPTVNSIDAIIIEGGTNTVDFANTNSDDLGATLIEAGGDGRRLKFRDGRILACKVYSRDLSNRGGQMMRAAA